MQFGCQATTQSIRSLPELLILILLPVSFYSDHDPRTPTTGDDENSGKCELIGTFSLLTQAILGLLCLSSLIVKRFYEYPLRRTWLVWTFDVSKQLIGAMGVHVFNVLLSILKTREPTNDDDLVNGNIRKLSTLGDGEDDDDGGDDPCDWYFLNIIFDCTIGVYVLYLVFKGVNKICRDYFHMTQIESGQYGHDPKKPSFRAFMKQFSIYFGCLMLTKFILYGILECFETQLLWITSHIILVWLDEYPDEFEIFIVMFVVPVVMNCLQLILIDNFIQNQVMHNANIELYRQHESSRTSLYRNDIEATQGEVTTLVRENMVQGHTEIKPGNKNIHHRDFDLLNHENDNSDTCHSDNDSKATKYGTFNDDDRG